MHIHTLKSGATLIVTSPGHGFRFSDGTECGGQDPELCSLLNCKRESRKVGSIKGHTINETKMVLTDEGIEALEEMSAKADIVMVPFPVLSAMREQGIREKFPNVVAMNATAETMRAAPPDKVVDVNNWSY